MVRIVKLITAFAIFLISPWVFAADLMSVYHDALMNDPTFKQAEANWLATRENLPIARSGYEPNFNVNGVAERSYNDQSPRFASSVLNINGWSNTYQYTLSAAQPIFNAPNWYAILGAKAQVKAASALYLASAQDLMQRTVQAYLAVLQAYDQLRYTIANKEAVYQQLITAKQKFNVGLIAITGVYDAQSVYDQAVATEIANRNTLNIALENLRAITSYHYLNLATLGVRLPLISPEPNNIAEWLRIAERQNFSILSQGYSVISAREFIKQQATAFLPVFNAIANYNDTHNTDYTHSPDTRVVNANVGVSFSLPFLSNGIEFVPASTRKARYQFLAASDQLEITHRQVINNASQAFLSVLAGISQIRADEQSIVSARKSIDATEAGYEVGTRTMVDVLNALATLYQNLAKYSTDQYTYLLNTVNLKQAAGTLSVDDLYKINLWLTKHIAMPISPSVYGDTNDVVGDFEHGIAPESDRIVHHKMVRAEEPKLERANVVVPADKIAENKTAESKPSAAPQANKEKGSFTIRLYSTPNEADAKYFIHREGLKDKAIIIHSNNEYKVIFGHYSTRVQATSALSKLPIAVKKYKPWVIRY